MLSLGQQTCMCVYSKASFEMWSLWGMIKYLRAPRFQMFNIFKKIFLKHTACFPCLRKQRTLGKIYVLRKPILWLKYHSGSASSFLDLLG